MSEHITSETEAREEHPSEEGAADQAAEKSEDKVEYSVSSGLVGRLAQLNISFAFTSYQSGLLYFVGRNQQNGINTHQAALPKPMGICMSDDGELTMTGGYQIMRFRNILEPEQRINNTFDACFVPRTVHVTGHLGVTHRWFNMHPML